MFVARSLVRLAAVGAAAIALAAAPLHAQGTSPQLSMPRITKMYNGLKELAYVVAAHPELGDSISIDGDATEEQAVASLARKPAVVAALARAGMTPRDYVDISMAYLGASMAYGFSKSVPNYKVPADQVANVAFLRAHEAELLAMQKRMEAELQKLAPKDSSAD